jgi:hypothetical protein
VPAPLIELCPHSGTLSLALQPPLATAGQLRRKVKHHLPNAHTSILRVVTPPSTTKRLRNPKIHNGQTTVTYTGQHVNAHCGQCRARAAAPKPNSGEVDVDAGQTADARGVAVGGVEYEVALGSFHDSTWNLQVTDAKAGAATSVV